MLHILVCALGGDDLLDVCLASVAKYAGSDYRLHVRYVPTDSTDPADHGRTINLWRQQQPVSNEDIVALMDPDCVLLSDWWRREMERAFALVSAGVWGAGSKEDFGPRVHASMMCVRGWLWNQPTFGFTPCPDPRERTWRDTGGLFCLSAVEAGWRVLPVERGEDWHGASAYWPSLYRNRLWDHCHERGPMWSHLGGGTHSDPTRLTWLQRLHRYKQIKQRHRWLAAVKAHLACS